MRLTVTFVGLAADNVPLLAETLNQLEVLPSDQFNEVVPALVRSRRVLLFAGNFRASVTAVNPTLGVICSASIGLGSATCRITTAGEQPQLPISLELFGVAVFHFCHIRLLVLRRFHAALAFVPNHWPKLGHRF